MSDAEFLRARLLSALGASVLVTALGPVACAGRDRSDEVPRTEPLPSASSDSGAPPAPQELEPSCSGAVVECFPPGQTHFNTGNTPTPVQPPEAIFDANGCQDISQVADGCCNGAQTSGFVDGQCCYGFCTGACCGRPMIVDGAPRLAAAERRSDWSAPLPAGTAGAALGGLSAELRGSIATAWLEDARLEHASIGSFARFALDLLSFAAPAELVEAAQRAMADELRHARDCFTLAGLYGGAPCGPGALDMSGVSPSISLAQAAAAAVREGCIGETIAALTARAQASAASVAQAHAALSRIAEDEASHAELAWRFVRWALEQGGAEVRSAVSAAFAEAHSELSTPGREDPNVAILNAHGRLSARQLQELRHQAIHEIALPCARGLLATPP